MEDELIPADRLALLGGITYYGDPAQCRMTVNQALAYAEVIETRTAELVSLGEYGACYAALIDIGEGNPVLVLACRSVGGEYIGGGNPGPDYHSGRNGVTGKLEVYRYADGQAEMAAAHEVYWKAGEGFVCHTRVGGTNDEYGNIFPGEAQSHYLDFAEDAYRVEGGVLSASPIASALVEIDLTGTVLGFNGGTIDAQPAAKTVTIKNTGTSSVTLQAPTSTNYVLGPLSSTTLAAGEEATFTVRPKEGLKTGVYTERIAIKTEQSDSESVDIDFQVKKKGPAFVDVKESSWFFADVEYAYEKGLMNGMGGNRFDPNGTTTRGQIVTILYRLEGEPAVSGRSGFTDVGSGQYYANAVKWASDHNIVNGYSNVKFGPNDPITREQMAAILYRCASYKRYNVRSRADLSKFTDARLISSYALDAIFWANSRGLINGDTGTTINPRGSATRAQVAAILHRFCENIA